ncbi:MAG TPA: aromatic ring-hydroxylating dioxygenase subunit alpha [Gemmatimonadaceae bacterium]|nr:aromatic ring-hydroxylating dioxygenase subunit alpha [Gemmatimonadaceae bacterium]
MTTFLKTVDIPIEAARTLPGRYYTSPDIFAEETDAIFAQRWWCVGRESDIANPGDYMLREIAGESIIVLRDESDTPRAFYNVCRHRGTRLCEGAGGRLESGMIQCPYHAWTYALDGRLLGAPSAGELEGFRKADYPLHAVALERWEGFLLLNLARSPEPFERAWAPLLGRFARFNLGTLVPARTIEYDVRANWKLLFENYSECYHCAPVHPSLARVTPPTSGENDLVEGPVTGGFMTINDGYESLTLSGRACGVPVGDLPADDRRRVYYYAIFPNLFLSLHPDYVMAHTLWPLAPDRTRIVCTWLFSPRTLEDPSLDPNDGVAFWDRTNREDWHICEQSQLGVASRMYQPGPYSRREVLSAQFDREVLRALGHAWPS